MRGSGSRCRLAAGRLLRAGLRAGSVLLLVDVIIRYHGSDCSEDNATLLVSLRHVHTMPLEQCNDFT